MVQRVCKCGTSFEVQFPSSSRTNCSAKCRGVKTKTRTDAGTRKSDWVAKTCPCGATGEVPPWRAPKPFYCSPGCAASFRPKQGRTPAEGNIRRLQPDGYVRIYVPPAERALGREHVSHHPEHRMVMARVLGRHLLPDENVHHINGDKRDNRPENLELWVSRQPKGQRVSDLLAFAREVIARYGSPEEAMKTTVNKDGSITTSVEDERQAEPKAGAESKTVDAPKKPAAKTQSAAESK